jgi:hypothetical protein
LINEDVQYLDINDNISVPKPPTKKEIKKESKTIRLREKHKKNTINVIMILKNGELDFKTLATSKDGNKFIYGRQTYHTPVTAYYRHKNITHSFYNQNNPNPIDFTKIHGEKDKPVYDTHTTEQLLKSKVITDTLKGEKGDSIEFIKKMIVIVVIGVGLLALKIYNIDVGGFLN